MSQPWVWKEQSRSERSFQMRMGERRNSPQGPGQQDGFDPDSESGAEGEEVWRLAEECLVEVCG